MYCGHDDTVPIDNFRMHIYVRLIIDRCASSLRGIWIYFMMYNVVLFLALSMGTPIEKEEILAKVF